MASKSTEPEEKKAKVMNKVERYNVCNNPNTTMVARMYNRNNSNKDYGVTMHNHDYYGQSKVMCHHASILHRIVMVIELAMCHHDTILLGVMMMMSSWSWSHWLCVTTTLFYM